MSLFTPDLYRNFGIGFGAGALAILLVNGTDLITPELCEQYAKDNNCLRSTD